LVSTSTNPEQTLEKLKNMLDKGMVTQEEYETKKKEVLNRI
jgi:CRISPR/Cas system-associated endonuclease/helicase Cas3